MALPPWWVLLFVATVVSIALTLLLPKSMDLWERCFICALVGVGVGVLIARLFGS